MRHPGILQESVDLAHNDIRTGTQGTDGGAERQQGMLGGPPAKGKTIPCGLQALLQCRIFTVKHVPAGCQGKVTSVLAGTLSAYCNDPCEARLFGVLAFPKLVLRTVPVKGNNATEQLVLALEQRLHLFQCGDYQSLWDQAMRDNPNANTFSAPVTRAAKRQKTGAGPPAERTLARVRELVAEGASKKALQLLTSTGIHDSSDPAVIEHLKRLHPAPDAPLPLYAPGNTTEWEYSDAATFWGPLVRSSILHFPRASAPGPSGLRPSHLQDAIKRPGHGNTLVTALALFTEAWVLGRLPDAHGPWLCGANLTPLRKPDGGGATGGFWRDATESSGQGGASDVAHQGANWSHATATGWRCVAERNRSSGHGCPRGGRQQTVYGALGTFEGGPEQCVQLHRQTKCLARHADAVPQPLQLLAFLLPAKRAPVLWGARSSVTDGCPPGLPAGAGRICTGDPLSDRKGADHSRPVVANLVFG